MMNAPEAVTLASLRAKTDRELVAIIEAAVERGLVLLRRPTNGDGVKAEQAYREAATLLPLVYELAEPDRHRINMRLAGLGAALNAEGPEVCLR